jgi:hypothetical protein
MWYGSTYNQNIKLNLKRKSVRLSNWQKQNNLQLKSRSSVYSYKFLFLIPSLWTLLVLTSKNKNHLKTILYVTSATYFFKISLPFLNSKPVFNKQLKLLELNFYHFYHSLSFYLNFIKALFLTFSLPLFLKLKFKGKGYYVFKNSRNTITPQSGFSHRIYIYSFSVLVKFLSKTTIFLFGLSKKDLLKNGLQIKNIRPINIFTGRGIRFAKQIVYRKVGKVSSYR